MGYSLSSKLSLTGNIGFRTYSPKVFPLGSSNQDGFEPSAIVVMDPPYSGIKTYVLGENVNSAADVNAINSLIRTIHQWQVSAGLKYAITRRFFAEGGLSIGFATTAISEYPIVTVNTNASSTDGKIANSFDSYNVIRSEMTSLYGGIGYKIGAHLDVSAQWSQGLNHYLVNENKSLTSLPQKRIDYIRGLNLGIRYNFSKQI